MTPFTNPTIAACHAGQAARADLDRDKAEQAALERHGRDVLTRSTPAQLAGDLRSAVFALQLEGKLAGIDGDLLEDLAAELAAAEHADTQEAGR